MDSVKALIAHIFVHEYVEEGMTGIHVSDERRSEFRHDILPCCKFLHRLLDVPLNMFLDIKTDHHISHLSKS